jgi:hypothetical protein
LQRAGWRQHEYGPPTGHPDRLQAWTGASTMNRYVDLALSGLDDWFDGAQVDLAILVAEDETARAVAETLADLVVAPATGSRTRCVPGWRQALARMVRLTDRSAT